MKKRLLVGLGILVASLVILLGGARLASAARESASHEVASADVPLPADPASLAEGERLFVSRGCGGGDCHQADGGGHVMMSDGAFGTIVASNLTTIARDLSAQDWDRAVRHGVRRDGRSLVFMPSGDFVAMPDRELGLIAAYARTLPGVERDLPPTSPGMLARVLDLAGAVELFPAGHIDHAAVAAPDAEPGRTVEHGAYLARLCTGCHGMQLSGGPIPGAPAELGNPRNLTFDETGLAGWSEQDFVRSMREGVTPDGATLDRRQMPWPDLSRMTDDELGAIYLYLQTVPHVAEGNR
ncbi:MAG: cytochrome c [Myxococcota bacterium]|nr:cytochrome c [Myxococcota bacterium]